MGAGDFSVANKNGWGLPIPKGARFSIFLAKLKVTLERGKFKSASIFFSRSFS
jgi:hypothetical protein